MFDGSSARKSDAAVLSLLLYWILEVVAAASVVYEPQFGAEGCARQQAWLFTDDEGDTEDGVIELGFEVDAAKYRWVGKGISEYADDPGDDDGIQA